MSDTIGTLLASPYPPPFIHLHHPHHPPSLALASPSDLPAHCLQARVDAIEHHTPRLFYSGILTRLGSVDTGEVSTWDEFVRRLKGCWTCRKGKGKVNGHRHAEKDHGEESSTAFVLVITKAERLRQVLGGGGWAALTRLSELSGIPISVVFASQVPWDELRPRRGDALEPIHIYLPPPTRDEILSQLVPCSEHPLWPRFLDLILSTLHPLLPSPLPTLFHLAEALWPLYTSPLPPHLEMTFLGLSLPQTPHEQPQPQPPPPLEITLKLLTDLKHHLSLPLSAAIETLLPLQLGSHEFTHSLLPTPDGQRRGIAHLPKPPPLDLGTAAKFLVVAAYCASYNPAKSDLRLFGRSVGVDGRKRRGGGMRRAGYGRVRIGKVPQRLVGPKPFPLDRLLALFASLFSEHANRPQDLTAALSDSDSSDSDFIPKAADRKRQRDGEREEVWEQEVEHLTMSVKLWGNIPELEAMGLLRRISPQDRLDAVVLRCEAGYDVVKTLARELGIILDEYLYEATA
ncbi:origin recognition complex subunit 5 C-terminus-domain-containing protein [Naematelia encephala]|uniref:Origin recognition complex subunit 5 C-terminus-domain-containing protein n=1 Tax=Naematelia encephala TaxID=71784 RepID=A0A1Y2AGL7_9TREE|nr:origin recognition complex subunit 5 C-terminus-domain-containing protein [Naematelia encephala]